MTYRILQGDCLRAMQAMPAGSVDLVFTSPPYEAARTYGIGFKLRGQAWAEWCADRFMECLRVCRGLVAWVVGHGQTRGYRWSAGPALLVAELHRRGACLRNPPIFHRVGIPGSGGPDWLRADAEWIVCGTAKAGRLPWSDNTAMGHQPKWAPGGEMSNRLTSGTRRNQWGGGAKSSGAERKADGQRSAAGRPSHKYSTVGNGRRRLERGNPKGSIAGKAWLKHTKTMANGDMQEQFYSPPVRANPGTVIKTLVGGGVMGSRLCHENEAPFPEALAEFFVRSFCPPNGTVLDPFSGSGTTAAVALKHGRNALAIDLRESQCALTLRRIQEAMKAEAAA